jgi:hypothetical protein
MNSMAQTFDNLGNPIAFSRSLQRRSNRLRQFVAHRLGYQLLIATLLCLAWLLPAPVHAQETVCARVKIEIKQELTLERQAFDAEMKINNTTDTGVIENVLIQIKVTDENGTPVAITDNPNDLSAKFFVRLSTKQNIDAIDGTGTVNPKTTSSIDWLLIPTPGSAGASPLGKKYLVGATLKYKFGAENTVITVAPDVITVKPLPLLTLDYFLPQDVVADDPLTPAIEPAEPFTLGVRVKNTGLATAKNLKIDSAQPKIIENNQGLLINFKLDGSYLNDAPAQNTLLINFGDVAGGSSKMGRWIMETSLAGKFTEFTAKFSHSDELGGSLTSILQAANAHFLIRDVRVDLPGRDVVRDFLAKDGDVTRIYESDGPDTEVIDRSSAAVLTPGAANANGNASYRLSFPPTAGFIYVKLPDPFGGAKALGPIVRSDAKQLAPENAWLSKTRNAQTKKLEYWVNFFDVNSSGVYDSQFQPPPAGARPPVLQFIPDWTTTEGKQVSFIVEASSPDGKPVTLSAAPLPTGAHFTQQAADPKTPGLARATFDWTPAKGAAGSYLVAYNATDGVLNSTLSATIKVNADGPPPGPGTPAIDAPLAGASVSSLTPALAVQTSANPKDLTTKVQFELYADPALTQLIASALLDKAAATATSWTPPATLADNTRYWWRARAFDGALYSPWVNGRFFVGSASHAPENFNLTSPAETVNVVSLKPQLSWTNSRARDGGGGVITYSVLLYRDAALTQLITQGVNLPENALGTTSWTPNVALSDNAAFYWRVIAKDASGAQTASAVRATLVKTGGNAPSTPVIVSPAAGAQTASANAQLTIQNSVDADNDPLTYIFELDTVNTFDSGAKQRSAPVAQGNAGSTSWSAANLAENQRYWWRAKARDGSSESAWAVGNFLVNAVNDAPPAPTIKNPGNGAWSAVRQPSLEANPVLDPEGDAVRYQFEIYSDAALNQKVAGGTSPNTALIVPLVLADKTTYWWRVRALDAQDAASDWSAPAMLFVSEAPYQDQAIALTAPVGPVLPEILNTLTGTLKQVTLRWEGTDPNSEPKVALYYSTSKTGFMGNLIVDGLQQRPGVQAGSYVWDVSKLAPGAYYVYAQVLDAKGIGKAYAPGAVVIPANPQTGTLRLIPPASWNEADTAQVGLAWTNASGAAIGLPLDGNGVLATQDDGWTLPNPKSAGKSATGVILPYQCSRQAQSGVLRLGPVVTEDSNLAGQIVTANFGALVVAASNTGDESLRVCEIQVLAERALNATESEFTVTAKLSNLGGALTAASITPVANADGVSVSGTLDFAVIASGELGRTQSVVKIRAPSGAVGRTAILQTGVQWPVQQVTRCVVSRTRPICN